jgi:O-antigen/teichoic acid export membrane protein
MPVPALSIRTRLPRFEDQVAQTFGVNAAIALLGGISGLLLARYLGPAMRGELAAIQLWPTFLSYVASFGLCEATTYYAAREPFSARRDLVTGVAITVAMSVPVSIAGYTLLPTLLKAQGEPIVALSRAYLFVVPIQALFMLVMGTIRGLGWTGSWNMIRVIQSGCWVATIVAVIAMGIHGAAGVAVAQMAMMLCLSLGVYLYAWAGIGHSTKGMAFMPGRLVKYSGPVFAIQLPQWAGRNVDLMVLASSCTAIAVGYYSVAVAWSGIYALAVLAVTPLILQRMSGLLRRADHKRMLTKLSRISVMVFTVLGVCALLITPWGVPLIFGKAYLPSIRIALILILAAMAGSVSIILGEAAKGIRLFRPILYAESIGLVVSLTLILVTVRIWGSVGVALGILMGRLAVLATVMHLVASALNVRLRDMCMPNDNDISDMRLRIGNLISNAHSLVRRLR